MLSKRQLARQKSAWRRIFVKLTMTGASSTWQGYMNMNLERWKKRRYTPESIVKRHERLFEAYCQTVFPTLIERLAMESVPDDQIDSTAECFLNAYVDFQLRLQQLSNDIVTVKKRQMIWRLSQLADKRPS